MPQSEAIISVGVAPDNLQAEEAVQNFYGKRLTKSSDLKTGACTSQPESYAKFITDAIALVHEEVALKYYGCGPVFPPALKGANILDLGSGSGRDSYALSKLVGPDGSITGLDITEEQVKLANRYVDYHTKLFNYNKPNITFVRGNMEKMFEAGFEDNQFDLVVSNGVINLAKDKIATLKEVHRVLKVGGEFHFSDIYADRDLPKCVREKADLWCECIGGTLWWRDLYELAKKAGFSTPRLVTAGLNSIEDKSYKDVVGETKFVSVTYSLFKLPAQHSKSMTVEYNGSIEEYEAGFMLDSDIAFKRGEKVCVKPELATILQSSRFKNFFTFHDGVQGPCKDSELVIMTVTNT